MDDAIMEERDAGKQNPQASRRAAEPVEAATPLGAPTAPAVESQAAEPPTGAPLTSDDVAREMEAAIAAGKAEATGSSAGAASDASPASSFELSGFPETAASRETADLELLDDVELEVTVELGRAEMYIEDVLRLGVGSVVELDRPAGDPVDVYVNKRLVARGEVLVLNDQFCVRVNDILSPAPESDE